jgi:hypothetical protein
VSQRGKPVTSASGHMGLTHHGHDDNNNTAIGTKTLQHAVATHVRRWRATDNVGLVLEDKGAVITARIAHALAVYDSVHHLLLFMDDLVRAGTYVLRSDDALRAKYATIVRDITLHSQPLRRAQAALDKALVTAMTDGNDNGAGVAKALRYVHHLTKDVALDHQLMVGESLHSGRALTEEEQLELGVLLFVLRLLQKYGGKDAGELQEYIVRHYIRPTPPMWQTRRIAARRVTSDQQSQPTTLSEDNVAVRVHAATQALRHRLTSLEGKASVQPGFARRAAALRARLAAFVLERDNPRRPSQVWQYLMSHDAELNDIKRGIASLHEDLSGSVRVYVRVRGGRPADHQSVINTTRPRRIGLRCSTVQHTDYDGFYGVFGEDCSNHDVFFGQAGASEDAPSLQGVFQQIADGYSVAIFGYGFSGSSKTYTLSGDPNQGTLGVMHYTLPGEGEVSPLPGVIGVRVHAIFEEYLESALLATSPAVLKGRVHELFGDAPGNARNGEVIDEKTPFREAWMNAEKAATADVVNLGANITRAKFSRLVACLNSYRLRSKRITATINNPTSSRSHLYIVLQFTLQRNAAHGARYGYCTMCDMAGRESPPEIFEQARPRQELRLFMLQNGNDDLSKILREGFYVAETLNHMKTYLAYRQGLQMTSVPLRGAFDKPTPYTPDQCFINPLNILHRHTSTTASAALPSDKRYVPYNYKPSNAIAGGNTSRCMTIPIFSYIDNLGGSAQGARPTKFVMLCCVRQEDKHCKDTANTLAFARSISSMVG